MEFDAEMLSTAVLLAAIAFAFLHRQIFGSGKDSSFDLDDGDSGGGGD